MLALAALFAFAVGLAVGVNLDYWIARRMWRLSGYCSNCDRLTCDREHS